MTAGSHGGEDASSSSSAGAEDTKAQRFEVASDEAPCRLDVFLSAHIPNASRVRIRRGIDDGTTTVDGKVRKASFKLATEFRKYRPRLVLGFGEKTPLASPDHWQAMQITDAAIFYSRLTKWDKEFAHHAPHTISAQLYFTLAFYSNNPLPGAGHLVVDISRTLATKMDAIQCYKTQFPPEKQHLFGRVEAMARQLGQTAGYAAGEMLVSPRNLGTKDLMKTLFG